MRMGEVRSRRVAKARAVIGLGKVYPKGPGSSGMELRVSGAAREQECTKEVYANEGSFGADGHGPDETVN
jgi:hypothetical protein